LFSLRSVRDSDVERRAGEAVCSERVFFEFFL